MKVVGSESKNLSFTEKKYYNECELPFFRFKNNLSFLILLIMYLIGKFKNFDENFCYQFFFNFIVNVFVSCPRF